MSSQLPSSDALVTMPSRCARRMPREIAGDIPKSSAFTTRRISAASAESAVWVVAVSKALRIMPEMWEFRPRIDPLGR